MSDKVRIHAVAPQVLEIVYEPSTLLPDLSVVSGVLLEVLSPSKVEKILSSAIIAQSADSITISHTFDYDDLDEEGDWLVTCTFTTPDGPIPVDPVPFQVIGKWDRTESCEI